MLACESMTVAAPVSQSPRHVTLNPGLHLRDVTQVEEPEAREEGELDQSAAS